MSDTLIGVLMGATFTLIATFGTQWNARRIAERQMDNQRGAAREEALRRWRIERALPLLDFAATRQPFYDEFAYAMADGRFDNDWKSRLAREQALAQRQLYGIADEPLMDAVEAFLRADTDYIGVLIQNHTHPGELAPEARLEAFSAVTRAVIGLNRAFEDYAFRAP